jgi:tetratricopeptide (TPR) repeat protein
MTIPLGAPGHPTRTAEFRLHGAPAPVPSTAVDGGAVDTRWSASPQARPTPDHLALVQALIEAGQLTRATELLDAVWHHDLQDEHCWYLRLWLLVGQGRVLEALELTRVAVGKLPGSAAVAYLHAALEHCAGDPEVAVEAALRASAIAPERPEPAAMLESVLGGRSARREDDSPTFLPHPGLQPALNPLAVALAGLGLLHPQGSTRACRPSLPASEPSVASGRREREANRRIWLIAVAMLVAAIWAGRDPLLASAALAAAVAWLSRPERSRRR